MGLVADLMREMGVAAIQKRASRRSTVPDAQAQIFDNHLDRKYHPDAYAPGQLLVSDITYLKTGHFWLYMATRMVSGWQLADQMRINLAPDALDMARTHGRIAVLQPPIEPTPHTSALFTSYCTEAESSNRGAAPGCAETTPSPRCLLPA